MRSPNNNIRAFLYARTASVSQINPIFHIEQQLKYLRLYAHRQLYQIIAEACDLGIGGITLSRPGLSVVMDGATSTPPAFDVLLVHECTRLARDPALRQELISRLWAAGVEIEFTACSSLSAPGVTVDGDTPCSSLSAPGGQDDQD